jgi:hypothetical protein
MHTYAVALRISGKSLDAAEVTAKLGLKPTQVRTAGQPRAGGRSAWDESMWEYEVLVDKRSGGWASLEKGLKKLIFKLHPHKRVLYHYQRRFRVCLYCGHFSSAFNGGPSFSPSLLKQLGDLGVELFLDTYSSQEPSR